MNLTESDVRAIVAEELDRFCAAALSAPTVAGYFHQRANYEPDHNK